MQAQSHSACSHASAKHAPDQDTTTLKDPVCGMSVTSQSPHHASFEGKTHYFCSARCKDKFNQNPKQYLGPDTHTLPYPARFIPAPCTPRYAKIIPATVPNAVWHSNRNCLV